MLYIFKKYIVHFYFKFSFQFKLKERFFFRSKCLFRYIIFRKISTGKIHSLTLLTILCNEYFSVIWCISDHNLSLLIGDIFIFFKISHKNFVIFNILNSFCEFLYRKVPCECECTCNTNLQIS